MKGRRRAWLWPVFALLSFAPTTEAALSLDGYDPDAREDLVLELALDRHTLDDAMLAIREAGTIYYPLGYITERLELGLVVEPDTGQVSGWLDETSRPLRFDGNTGEGLLGDEPFELSAEAVHIEPEDIYLQAQALARLLPITVEFDEREQAVRLSPDGPLPLLQRLERQARWNDLRDQPGARASRPLTPLPYRPWSLPAWSLELEHRHYSREDWPSRTDAEMRVAGDLGYHEARLYARATEDGLHRADATLARDYRNPWLTRYELGHVRAPASSMLTRNRSGLGVMATNAPHGRPVSGLGDQRLSGDAPDGWSAELYHNGQLVDFIDAVEGGRYIFESAPVSPGENRYDIMLYGPRGQVRTERETVFAGPGMLAPGEIQYDISHFRTGESLVGDFRAGVGPVDEGRGRLRVGMGLHQRLSGALEVHASENPVDHPEQAMVAELTGSLGMTWLRVRRVDDGEEGSASAVELHRPLGKWSIGVGHQQIDGLVSEEYGTRPLTSRTELSLNGPVRDWFHWRSDYRRDEGEDGGLAERLRLYQTTRFGAGGRLSHRLERHLEGDTAARGHGFLDLGWHARMERYGIGLRYTAEPEGELDYLRGSWNRQLNRTASARVELRGGLSERFTHALTAGLSMRMSRVALGIGGTYEEDGEWSVTAGIETGARPDPHYGGWSFSADGRRYLHDGGAAVRVVRQEGVERFPQAGVVVRGGGRQAKTGPDGVAHLSGLEPYRQHDIELDLGVIEDPFIRRISGDVSIAARPGAVQALEYRLALTGEVEGTVRRQQGDGREPRPLPAIRVVAEDVDGNIVARTSTAFDGLYILDRLLPGRYSIRIHEDDAGRLGVDVEETRRPVEIDGDGDIVSGIDILI